MKDKVELIKKLLSHVSELMQGTPIYTASANRVGENSIQCEYKAIAPLEESGYEFKSDNVPDFPYVQNRTDGFCITIEDGIRKNDPRL